jgi:hypothetical protein
MSGSAKTRVADARSNAARVQRSDRSSGVTAIWLGDEAFSPKLDRVLSSQIDEAFASTSAAQLRLLAANVGAYRFVERSQRVGGDPLVLMLGPSVGANIIGNLLGSAITDRLLTDEIVNQEYWAVAIAVDVDGKTVVATNRRRKSEGEDAATVLPQLIQFTVDDLALKYRIGK